MKMDFKIRIAQQSDSAELRDLYKNTVLVVNRPGETNFNTEFNAEDYNTAANSDNTTLINYYK